MLLGVLIVHTALAQAPPTSVGSMPAARLICTRGQIACAALVPLPLTRSFAARERERAEHALERLPMSWQVIYLLVPRDDPQALDELNGLVLMQLNAQVSK